MARGAGSGGGVDRQWAAAHLTEEPEVRPDRSRQRRVRSVGRAIGSDEFLDVRLQLGLQRVREARHEVMGNLAIKAAHKPAEHNRAD